MRNDNLDLISDDDATDLVEVDLDLNERQELFCQHYVKNGFVAVQAAISAGYSEDSARTVGPRLLRNAAVTRRVAMLMAPGLRKNGIEIEEMLGQIAAVAKFDHRKLYDANGNRIPVHMLDDETAAGIQRINAGVIGQLHGDVVPYDKMKAVDMAMKYLGAYEKDNAQKAENLALQIILV